MDVFRAFPEINYTYLEISRGGVYGNRIVSERELKGIFKLRSGMTSSNNQELRESNATLKVHPSDFSSNELVGNGIRIDTVDYQIVGMTESKNFENGKTEHLNLTLERANYGNRDN